MITRGERVTTNRAQKKVVLVNAWENRATAIVDYDLITHAGMTEDEIRQYSDFKVSFHSTLDQATTVAVGFPNMAVLSTLIISSGQIYTEANVIPATSGHIVCGSAAGGTGSDATYKVVPALRGVHSNIIVRLLNSVAPSSGSITVVIEMVA